MASIVAEYEPSLSSIQGVFHFGHDGIGKYAGFGGQDLSSRTTLSVETVVYSLKSGNLVWTARSKTTAPDNAEQLIDEVAAATAIQLMTDKIVQ